MGFGIPLAWILTGYLGGRIVARKGYEPKYGVVLGCFGCLGLIVALALPMTQAGREMEELEYEITHGPKRANCPNCGKQIKYGSQECPHCQYAIALSRKGT
jgi:hypothetical protein